MNKFIESLPSDGPMRYGCKHEFFGPDVNICSAGGQVVNVFFNQWHHVVLFGDVNIFSGESDMDYMRDIWLFESGCRFQWKYIFFSVFLLLLLSSCHASVWELLFLSKCSLLGVADRTTTVNEDNSTVGMFHVPINYSDNLVLTELQIRHAGSVLPLCMMSHFQ